MDMNKNSMYSLGFILMFSKCILANTYFIDYTDGLDANPGTSKTSPWKKCPGMNGFNSAYTHAPGDVFIFKGGVVWPAEALPLIIAASGTAGNVDTYTTDHTWEAGSIWSQPTLDGQLGGKTMLSSSGASFFKINDMRFINAGTVAANGIKGAEFSNCSNFEISNNTFAFESWGCLYIWTSEAKTFHDYSIHNNDISKSAFGIRVVPSGAASIIQNVQIFNNSLHDFHSQLSGEVHGDGIQNYCSPDNAASSDRYIDGFKIFNNSFTGDFSQVTGSTGAMTALIYLSSSSKGVEIYNNLFAPSFSGKQSPNFFESFISLRDNPNRGGFHKIYDNTFATPVADGQGAAILEDDTLHPSPNLDVKNNIFNGFQWPFDLRSTNHVFDHNDVHFTKNVGKWNGKWVETFSAWQALGNDVHGISADPLFVSGTNFHLHPGSPCVDHGANLGSTFAIDRDGTLRPQGQTFDLGAFETIGQATGVQTDKNPSLQPKAALIPGANSRFFDLNGRTINAGKGHPGTGSIPIVVMPDGKSPVGAQVETGK